MDEDDRQFLLTTIWLFARHGQRQRARTLCEVLIEERPQDGLVAAVLAEMMLKDREAEPALRVLRGAVFPPELARAAAMLECRALVMLGRRDESEKRWKRYLASSQGGQRNWVAE